MAAGIDLNPKTNPLINLFTLPPRDVGNVDLQARCAAHKDKLGPIVDLYLTTQRWGYAYTAYNWGSSWAGRDEKSLLLTTLTTTGNFPVVHKIRDLLLLEIFKQTVGQKEIDRLNRIQGTSRQHFILVIFAMLPPQERNEASCELIFELDLKDVGYDLIHLEIFLERNIPRENRKRFLQFVLNTCLTSTFYRFLGLNEAAIVDSRLLLALEAIPEKERARVNQLMETFLAMFSEEQRSKTPLLARLFLVKFIHGLILNHKENEQKEILIELKKTFEARDFDDSYFFALETQCKDIEPANVNLSLFRYINGSLQPPYPAQPKPAALVLEAAKK